MSAGVLFPGLSNALPDQGYTDLVDGEMLRALVKASTTFRPDAIGRMFTAVEPAATCDYQVQMLMRENHGTWRGEPFDLEAVRRRPPAACSS